MKNLNKEIFIDKSSKKHNNKYDYSLVEYKNNKTKVKIICNIHGTFEQFAGYHLAGCGCPSCGGTVKMSNQEFIKKGSKVHNNKYDYSLVEYKNNKEKVKIVCVEHGIFLQKPDAHLAGRGCIMCGNNNKKLKTDDFISRSNSIHNNKYDYSLVDYKNSKVKLKIICPTHGVFEQTSRTHLLGRGCPICSESKGEFLISRILENLNLNFIKQKKFENCIDIKTLPFDFYVPYLNLCIEYDGLQHFEPIDWFGGENNFFIVKKHDQIRNDYCRNNNIDLLRINYKDNIEEKLKKFIYEKV